MIDFGTWPIGEARRYRDEYAAAVPLREDWLAEELTSTGGDRDWLSGPEGLPSLWLWFTRRLDKEHPGGPVLHAMQPEKDPQPGDRPPWYVTSGMPTYVSDGALWLIELLGCHLATLVLDGLPGAHWDVYVVPKRRRDVDQHRTMLNGVGSRWSDPARMVYGEVIGHVLYGKPWAPTALSRMYEFTVSGAAPTEA